jgi:saccharopine dehydrogenase (NAD+, L-lysine-forming)
MLIYALDIQNRCLGTGFLVLCGPGRTIHTPEEESAMSTCIGIRREDKSEWERRVPITPEQVAALHRQEDLSFAVQPSPVRVFSDAEFAQAGAQVREDLDACPVVLAIKEIPEEVFRPGGAYVFFSHTIKGQPYNMPMLQRMLDLECTLIDYERIVDDKNRRLVFFGRHAGLAGMIDTLWALGQRLAWEGIANPFTQLQQTHSYASLNEAQAALRSLGDDIRDHGLPTTIVPLVCGFAGYGNVSSGAQEILDCLPVELVEPSELAAFVVGAAHSRRTLYKVVFREEHMVEPRDPAQPFELHDYYQHPEKYRGVFAQYVPRLTVLVNGIYWTEDYPRLVTIDLLRQLWASGQPRLRVIGDVSCDVEGAIECTVKCTEPDEPVFVYDPLTGQATDGYAGRGVVVLAVDILPSELPREASAAFGEILRPFLPAIARADYNQPFEKLRLPPEIKRAVIAHRGQLTPDYQYLQAYLD